MTYSKTPVSPASDSAMTHGPVNDIRLRGNQAEAT